MAFSKKSRDNKCWWGCGERETLCTVGGKVNWRSHKIQQFPSLGIYPKEMKTESRRDTCNPMFIAALFTISQDMEQPQCLRAWSEQKVEEAWIGSLCLIAWAGTLTFSCSHPGSYTIGSPGSPAFRLKQKFVPIAFLGF